MQQSFFFFLLRHIFSDVFYNGNIYICIYPLNRFLKWLSWPTYRNSFPLFPLVLDSFFFIIILFSAIIWNYERSFDGGSKLRWLVCHWLSEPAINLFILRPRGIRTRSESEFLPTWKHLSGGVWGRGCWGSCHFFVCRWGSFTTAATAAFVLSATGLSHGSPGLCHEMSRLWWTVVTVVYPAHRYIRLLTVYIYREREK